jgi:hypothetical protein
LAQLVASQFARVTARVPEAPALAARIDRPRSTGRASACRRVCAPWRLARRHSLFAHTVEPVEHFRDQYERLLNELRNEWALLGSKQLDKLAEWRAGPPNP